jgi:hypothetical protein
MLQILIHIYKLNLFTQYYPACEIHRDCFPSVTVTLYCPFVVYCFQDLSLPTSLWRFRCCGFCKHLYPFHRTSQRAAFIPLAWGSFVELSSSQYKVLLKARGKVCCCLRVRKLELCDFAFEYKKKPFLCEAEFQTCLVPVCSILSVVLFTWRIHDASN